MKWIFLVTLILSGQLHAESLKLLSWNVFMLPAPLKYSLQTTRSKEIARQLKGTDFDVIVFQEAFTRNFRQTVGRELKKDYPYSFYLQNHLLMPRVFGSGVLVMSKHPFKVLKHVHFKNCAIADCGAGKGSFVVEVVLPQGKVVQLAGTHLQANSRYANIRLKQLKQIHSMLKTVARPDVPQLLIGDLNIDFTDREFEEGKSLLDMDHLRLDGEIDYTGSVTNNCYKTGGDGISHKWIDHVWARGIDTRTQSMQVKPMTFEWKGKTCWLSDHHALESEIIL